MSDQQALLARYHDILSIRAGETEADARGRRKFASWHRRCGALERYRKRATKAQSVLAAHGVAPEDQVAMIRLELPEWASWLAAEAVHGRKPAEDDLRNLVNEALNG
ncbi:hypothetical protein [Brevundimonas naejangsanensis]|uniref:hypothetical protein n=1 Tax=Brevundimonas naejangsanensis TaxID=588932 RepID=UPI0034D723FB